MHYLSLILLCFLQKIESFRLRGTVPSTNPARDSIPQLPFLLGLLPNHFLLPHPQVPLSPSPRTQGDFTPPSVNLPLVLYDNRCWMLAPFHPRVTCSRLVSFSGLNNRLLYLLYLVLLGLVVSSPAESCFIGPGLH